MHEEAQTSSKIQLPLSVVDRIDLARLLREVDALNNFLEAANTREPDVKPKMPKTSRLLDEILQQNRLDALLRADRDRLKEFLQETKTDAPVIHISFSADPPPLFSQKLIAWLRAQIHPFILLQVGLQPTIGAGCIVRTTNKQFDFSLRQRLIAEQGVLIKKMRELTVAATPKVEIPVASPVFAEPNSKAKISPQTPNLVTPQVTVNPSAQPVVPLGTTPEHSTESGQ